MTKKRTTLIITAAVLVAAVFAGCTMLEATLATPDIILRIETFQLALNSPIRDGAIIAGNFAPAPTTAMADQIRTTDFWNAQFDPDYTYDFALDTIIDVSAVEGTMTATFTATGTEETPVAVTFKMVESDGNWVIEEYYEQGTAVVKLIDMQ